MAERDAVSATIAAQAILPLSAITAGTPFKVAMRARAADFASCLNGGALATKGTGSFPTTLDRADIGKRQSALRWFGTIARVAIWRWGLADPYIQLISA